MFGTTKAFGGFSVDDSDKARQFYGEVLGMDIRPAAGMEQFGILELHIAGGNPMILYPKSDHQPASFTVLNFPVEDIDAAVDGLTAKGVRFIQYDDPHIPQDAQAIARAQPGNPSPSIAWFKDPAGNILAVLQNGKEE